MGGNRWASRVRWGARILVAGLALLVWVAGLVLLTAAFSRPPTPPDFGPLSREPNTETRDFTISVDGKPAGHYRMIITRPDNHTLVMSGQANVRVSRLFITYRYSYSGKETYRDGKLVDFHSHCNDNGQRFKVVATAEKDGLRINVNGKERPGRAETWPTSYWRLPAGPRNRKVVLLDADTGKEMAGSLRYVGEERLTLAGKEQACTHYQVKGPPSPVDLWYDGEQRLLRQDYLDEGHRTVLELKQLTLGKPSVAKAAAR